MRTTTAVLLIVLAVAAGPGPASAGHPPEPRLGQGDDVVLAGNVSLFEGPLPRGPMTAPLALPALLEALAFTPEGRLLAIRRFMPPVSGPPLEELVEVGEDGQLLPIGSFEVDGHEPRDLAATADGRLFLLTFWSWWNPPERVSRLVELDPATGTVTSDRELGEALLALAPAPGGLWALGDRNLFRLDPATGALSDTGIAVIPGGRAVLAADADSTGALWFLTTSTITSPPILELWRLDPATGSLRDAPFAAPQSAAAGALAIRRRCVETATARCLQGGRFRVEVGWRDFDDLTGPGRVAPARSADSALFWFFDPANWELLVKVLDGCDHNGHFWVFAAATTDVAYSLRVTDLETDDARLFENDLGEAAPAITETAAFRCPEGP